MPRLMSVAMTVDAVIERRKTVTRRKGWLMLKPGDRLTLLLTLLAAILACLWGLWVAGEVGR